MKKQRLYPPQLPSETYTSFSDVEKRNGRICCCRIEIIKRVLLFPIQFICRVIISATSKLIGGAWTWVTNGCMVVLLGVIVLYLLMRVILYDPAIQFFVAPPPITPSPTIMN